MQPNIQLFASSVQTYNQLYKWLNRVYTAFVKTIFTRCKLPGCGSEADHEQLHRLKEKSKQQSPLVAEMSHQNGQQ